MSSETIKWHRRCLENMGRSIESQRDKISNLKEDMDRNIEGHLFLGNQIEEAIKRKKETFDSSRFLVKRFALEQEKEQ